MLSRTSLALAALAALVLSGPTALASQLWTVGPGGGTDFPTPGAALASPLVQDGDVLSVAGGSYAAFTVHKAVHIVGSAPVWVQGHLKVEGVDAVTLVDLRPVYLELTGVAGPARLREVHVGGYWGSQGNWVGSTTLSNCADVLAEHSSFRGTHGCYPDEGAGYGVYLSSSRAVFVDCLLEGGTAFADFPAAGCGIKPTLSGGAGLILAGASDALLASSTVRGGTSGDWYPTDAAGVRVIGLANVVVRGRSADALAGGALGLGTHSPAVHLTQDGLGSQVAVSGVAVTGTLPAGTLTPTPPQPFLRQAPSGPAAATLWLHGESSLPALLVAGLPGPVLSTVFGPLWLDLAGPLPFLWLNLAGHETGAPFAVAFGANPALAGLHAQFQALVFELSPGRSELTNPIAISLGY